MLKILDINKFIKTNKILEVTERASFRNDGTINDSGLYSKTIFGSTSQEISEQFGYINLTSNVMHPSIIDTISKVNTIFKKVALGTEKVVLNDGKIEKAGDTKGSTGPGWLFNNWDKIKFKEYTTEKNQDIISYFMETPRNMIFIDKLLVIPMKFRMYTEQHGITIEDELTMLYKKVLGITVLNNNDNELMKSILKNSSKTEHIQNGVYEIYAYFLNLLEKKTGSFRGNLISKRIDNNVRLVANARPDIPFNCAGLPWHVLINVFDVYVVASLNKKIFSKDYQELLETKSFSMSQYGKHFDYIFRNVDTYTDANPGKRELWVEFLKEMFDFHTDLRVLLKRDPAWNNKSYHGLRPVIIPTNSFHVVVNSLLYKPLGGDSFTTSITTHIKESDIVSNEQGLIRTKGETSYHIKNLDYIRNTYE